MIKKDMVVLGNNIISKLFIAILGKSMFIEYLEKKIVRSFTIGNKHKPDKITHLLEIYGHINYDQQLKYRVYPLQFSIINENNHRVIFSYGENVKGEFENITEKIGYDTLSGYEILEKIKTLCST